MTNGGSLIHSNISNQLDSELAVASAERALRSSDISRTRRC